ncbi:MAG: 30S ribosomal protein S17 [Bacteroidota bacterium]
MSTEETQPTTPAEETVATAEETQPTTSAEETVAAAEETAAPQIVMIAPEEPAKEGRNERKTRVGIVVSDKMDKTIAVSVERRLQHPIYGKYVKKNKKFIAHDENNECGIGDTVRIQETRPLSRRKRWRLVQILEKAK